MIEEAVEREYLSIFDRYIRAFERGLDKIMKEYREHELFPQFMESMRGGKRLRPVLLMLTQEACGGGDEDVIPAAVAIEILHTVSLIHDDIIDEEKVRRGRLPMYISAGLKSAVLSADYAFSIILDLSSRYRNKEVTRVLSKAASEMSVGELKEMKALKEGRKLSLDEYLNIISLKTASLFKAATQLGALLSKGASGLVEEFESFGYNLGMAYQLRDDLRDLDKKRELTSLLDVGDKAMVLMEEMRKYVERALEKLEKVSWSVSANLLKKLAVDFLISI